MCLVARTQGLRYTLGIINIIKYHLWSTLSNTTPPPKDRNARNRFSNSLEGGIANDAASVKISNDAAPASRHETAKVPCKSRMVLLPRTGMDPDVNPLPLVPRGATLCTDQNPAGWAGGNNQPARSAEYHEIKQAVLIVRKLTQFETEL